MRGRGVLPGERKPDADALDAGEWNYSESEYGPFERIVPLAGLHIHEDKVDATASKGIVTITLPLMGEAEIPAKKVRIRPS
jgi:HSP20 family molecular chaperone IbpA